MNVGALLAAILAGVMLGLIVGSFVATLCIRWSRGEQVLFGRSRCDGCGTVLSPRDLVPVLSAAVARGKCRSCGMAIDSSHSRIELVAAAIGGGAMALAPGPGGVALAVFGWLLLPLAILDARHFWLPDRLTLALAVAGTFAGSLLSGASFVDRVIGGVVGFGSLALIAFGYRRLRGLDGLGAGDAKLFGAIGLWTGWVGLVPVLVLASMTGLGLAAVERKGARDMMPFGTLLAIGAVAWSALVLAGADGVIIET